MVSLLHSEWSQVTSVSDVHSSLGFPMSGVPQGSVLSPTLFSAFINNFPDTLPPDSTVHFADDTTIFIVGKDPKLLNDSIQSCLDLANSWMSNNGLKLNVSKTKCMLIRSLRSRNPPPTLDIQLRMWLQDWASYFFKFLGVIVSDTLLDKSYHSHHQKRVTAGKPLETAILVSPFLSACPLSQIIHPSMCWLLWWSLRLQTLFNYGCRIALHLYSLSSSSALWKDLGLSSLASHRKLHLAELMFKCHSSLAPPYLTSLSTHHLTSTPLAREI